MGNNRWHLLQLFAGEGTGDGGDGAATGVNDPADAGQRRLQELGVPASKIRKRASKAVGDAMQSKTAPAEPQAEGQAAAAAEEKPTEETKQNAGEPAAEKPQRLTWEQIMADPEYNREMQETVRKRTKAARAATEALTKLAPALEVLARKYNMDASELDYAALAKAVESDDDYYEGKAMEMGVSVETVKRLDQAERETARRQREAAEAKANAQMQQHFQQLETQSAALKSKFPAFDLRRELQNPTFVRLTAPGSGLSVEDAYYAIHRKEIQSAAAEATARQTAENLSRTIQAQRRRPEEGGTSAQAPSVTTFDYRTATKEQREALKAEIRKAAARGEKVYPGR